jgi:hypothetical protein
LAFPRALTEIAQNDRKHKTAVISKIAQIIEQQTLFEAWKNGAYSGIMSVSHKNRRSPFWRCPGEIVFRVFV